MKHISAFLSTALRYGAYLGLSLIALFIIMQIVGLAESLAFRIIDVLIIYIVIAAALHYYQHHERAGHSYLLNLGLSAVTSFFGMLLFSLFIFIYTSIDTGYLDHLRHTAPMGPYLNPYIIAALLLISGIAVGMLSGFIQAFYIKDPEF